MDVNVLSYIQWFDNVCNQLSSEPQKATAILSEFRDSEQAFNVCKTLLPTPKLSSQAQFQAVLILQHSCLKHWNELNKTDKDELKIMLWTVIEGAAYTKSLPSYTLNKCIQLYALIWKREWNELDEQGKAVLFHQIVALLQHQSQDVNVMKVGASILLVTVEEFNSKSSAEVGLPLEFHRVTRNLYESYGINESFQLALQSVNHSISLVTTAVTTSRGGGVDASIASAAAYMNVSIQALMEIINWEHGSSDDMLINLCNSNSNGSSNNAATNQLLCLPRLWSSFLMQNNFLNQIYTTYESIRAILLNPLYSASSGITAAIDECMNDCRLILISMASVTGKFFENDDEKMSYASFLIIKTCPLLNTSINTSNVTNTSKTLFDDIRSKECEQFSTLLLRLLGNFDFRILSQMQCFESMLVVLGNATFVLSREMAEIAQMQLSTANSCKSEYDDVLFDGWRANVNTLLLDGWSLMLSDHAMLQNSVILGNALQAEMVTISSTCKHGVHAVAGQIFKQLFECVLLATICESLLSNSEEEDEDNEAISGSNMNDIVAAVSTIGRTNYVDSINFICVYIENSIAKCKQLLSCFDSNECIRQLEILRVGVLFVTHILDDNFAADGNKSSTDSNKSSEIPIIPTFILDGCMMVSAEASAAVFTRLIALLSEVIELQCYLLTDVSASHTLVSPYLLQHVMNFFNSYVLIYVQPDLSLYNANITSQIPHLFSMHAGASLAATITLLLSSMDLLIRKVPLENELILCASQLMVSISKSLGDTLGNELLSLPSVTSIFMYVTNQTHASSQCKLNIDGLNGVCNALSYFAIKTSSAAMLTQLCSYIHSSVMTVYHNTTTTASSLSSVVDRNKYLFEVAMACMKGVAGSPRGKGKEEAIVHELFNVCLPVASTSITVYGTFDDMTKLFLLVLCRYAEFQLPYLDTRSSNILYSACLQLLQLFSVRLATVVAVTNAEDVAYRSDVIYHLLELLNHLSNKDFTFDDDDASRSDSGISNGVASISLSSLLLLGLEVLLPLLSADLLRSFPKTCDRYYSFVAFVVSSHSKELALRFQQATSDSSVAFLSKLINEHLLWGSSGIDTAAARLSLQSLQSLASYHIIDVKKGGHGFGEHAHRNLFPGAIQRLLEMVIFPNTCEYGISWDRMDGFANALIMLISIDQQRFTSCAQSLISQQQPQYQSKLIASFEKLITNNNVNITSIDKSNRVIFTKNIREFIIEVRALVFYK